MDRIKHKIKYSPISTMHFVKLAVRLVLLAAALVLYVISRVLHRGAVFGGIVENLTVILIMWVMFSLEMVLRFFPSKIESPGCQKQFAEKFIPVPGSEGVKPFRQAWWRTFLVALSWIALNGTLGALYFTHIIDDGILILVSLAYSVCDMICILFFCPFQTWMMKNRCCTTCRIYNWDFAMMFTPLIFILSIPTSSLVVLSVALLIEWELIYRLHPERFSDNTNAAIKCVNCNEKLCYHKKQLQHFIKSEAKKLHKKFIDSDKAE